MPSRAGLLPFEADPGADTSRARGASGKYTAEVVNTGNVDAAVELTLDWDPGVNFTVDPARLQLANGGDQRAACKASCVITGSAPGKVTAFTSLLAGSQRLREGALLICDADDPRMAAGHSVETVFDIQPDRDSDSNDRAFDRHRVPVLPAARHQVVLASAPAVTAGGTSN